MVKNEDQQARTKIPLGNKEGTASSTKNLGKKMSLGAKEETALSSTGIHYKKSPHRKRTGDEIEEFKSEYSTTAHILSPAELEEFYETSLQTGLTQNRADKLLVENGPNCLIGTPPRSRVWLLLEFLFGGFAALLWIGAVLSLVGFAMTYTHDLKANNITNSTYDQMCLGLVLIVVILVTGVFGYYQEARNAAILDSFQKMSPKQATVIRDGEKKNIPCEEIVLGDLVVLEAGMWIPADVRLFDAQGLKVDNSAITGESLPQSRGPELTHNNPIETANLAFYTCCVVEGAGKGIAINCGDHTLLGHIAGLTSALQKGQTPIRREINYFIKIITIISLMTGITFFAISMIVGFDFFHAFSFFIALVVANVPEGLPVTLTACMTLTAKRMARKNCLVKKLEAIETLGCCNVICSDKTGTLTQNKMTVTHVYYDTVLHNVLHDPDLAKLEDESFQMLSRVAALCSRARFVPESESLPVDQREVIGDASESAILKFMEKKLGNVGKMREQHPKLAEIPFNSANKYQVSVHGMPNQRHVVLMKGAPERVLEKCSTYLHENNTQPFDEKQLKVAKKAVTHLGAKGERVLAFADLELDGDTYPPGYEFNADNKNFPLENLRFIGLISLIDPPRATVPDAVAKCRSAGIKVIMVTGDHPVTAAAIAKEVGILSEHSTTMYDIALRRDVSISMVTEQEKMECTAAVITGQDLRDMAEGQLEAAIDQYDEIVFARTSPQQKLKIVEAFQKSGMVVAVTGDGVNDSPALKKADIGIAMGITGSDVSKEAADMILMDDNFSSIVTGVEEGRLIFDNLKKSIAYLLTSNVPEILPFVAMTMLNTPPVCSVIAVIIIDVGTDLWPAISLAYEKAEADIMLRKPRNPKFDKLVNKRLIFLTYAQIGVMQSFASFAAYLHLMTNAGFLWYNLGSRRMAWLNESVTVTDDYGRKWSYAQRMTLTRKAYSAYFLAIVLTQVFDLFICKTRRLSLFQQGMRNWVMNCGVVFELSLGMFVVFCPKVQTFFQFEPVSPMHILPAVPYAIGILVFDELRKWCIRRYPSGIVYKETYY